MSGWLIRVIWASWRVTSPPVNGFCGSSVNAAVGDTAAARMVRQLIR